MISCKPVDTPISTSKVIMLPDPLFSDATCFYQIMGALQYLTLRDQIFTLLLIESVSLCIFLQILFGLSLNAFCVILRV